VKSASVWQLLRAIDTVFFSLGMKDASLFDVPITSVERPPTRRYALLQLSNNPYMKAKDFQTWYNYWYVISMAGIELDKDTARHWHSQPNSSTMPLLDLLVFFVGWRTTTMATMAT
jgi:hypothetical protein